MESKDSTQLSQNLTITLTFTTYEIFSTASLGTRLIHSLPGNGTS
jgi:hypothetical protein